MIFIRYENFRSYLKYYPITSLILAANLIMYCIVRLNGSTADVYNLLHFGAIASEPPYSQDWWRYISAIFLHQGFDHLLFNCFAILVFAPPLEKVLGYWKYAVLYLLSGVVGNVLSMAFYRHAYEATVSVGASGAIYGIYGAFLYIAFFQRQLMDESSRKTLYTLLIVGVVFSFAVSTVNWMGHLGGLAGGFVVYGLYDRLRLLKHR